ncbi:hypothetical protein GCM10011491_30460 [Brucella endophytica]|uniref:Uncharacterized protein n=1 Tax=Brucella endophytica TaxID=1963359 RepID=A0A916SGT1_9HYPH|nr:hypothetical protein GCM10011491_30460 [Brucella endophytica]
MDQRFFGGAFPCDEQGADIQYHPNKNASDLPISIIAVGTGYHSQFLGPAAHSIKMDPLCGKV